MPRNARLPLLLLALRCLVSSQPLGAATEVLPRYPDLHGETVVFTYADDLWRVPRQGGVAQRLTSLAAKKMNAKISPDGASVAFTALAGGNVDVYLAPLGGGPARRLTYHPALDVVVGWTPDGRSVLFTSRRESFTHPLDKLFTVPREGGAARPLPLAQGGPGSFSPDGRRLAYNRSSTESWNPWRGYRGGRRASISVFDLDTHRETVAAPSEGNDVFPLWRGTSLYFASDRDGRMNLFQLETTGDVLRRLTRHRDADVRHPSLSWTDPPRIVYELGVELRVLSLAEGRDEVVPVRVEAPLPEREPRRAAVAPYLTSFSPSPVAGEERALISARGEIFAVEATAGQPDAGRTENRTRTSGVREHGAVYAPDGRSLAYLSDAGGEYEVYLREAGQAEGRRLTREGAGFRQGLRFSPDGRRLLFTDQRQSLLLLDVATAAVRALDRSRQAAIESYDWSPDGSAVVYARKEANQLSRLHLYDLARGRSEPLGDGMTDDDSPVFDSSGRTIYFLSARTLRTSFSDFEQTFNFNDSVGVYALPVAAGSGARAKRLPVEPGSLSQLARAGGQLFYLARDRRTGSRALHALDLGSSRDEVVAERVDDYGVAGETVLVRSGERLAWLQGTPSGAAPRSGQGSPARGGFDLGKLDMDLDPPAEWRQIFADAWRFERDFFHQPSLDGVDWPAVRARYEPLLARLGSRDDLNALLGTMVAELGTSHSWAFGGDGPRYDGPPGGVLGADFGVASGRYRIERVIQGDPGADDARSPLAEVGARPGELLLAVDGRPLDASQDLFAAFAGKAGKPVVLTLGPTPDGHGARTVEVEPVAGDMGARYVDWVRRNRERVARATGGRCGYVHVPDTGRGGIAAFARDFFAQIDREALIIDVRWNSGGLFPAAMIEHLARTPLAAYAQRYGDDVQVPAVAVRGPKVLLTNGNTGSGGDAFAIYFRAAGVGPIVGTRTLGATIGNVGMPLLVDNGEVGVAALAYRPPAGGPPVENTGVAPDFEVEPASEEGAAEPDPQLARAIDLIAGRLGLKASPAPP